MDIWLRTFANVFSSSYNILLLHEMCWMSIYFAYCYCMKWVFINPNKFHLKFIVSPEFWSFSLKLKDYPFSRMNMEEYIAFCIVSKICGWKGYIVLTKQMSVKDVFMKTNSVCLSVCQMFTYWRFCNWKHSLHTFF